MARTDSASGDPPYLAYRRAIATYGASFEATCWQSRAMQGERFDVMLSMIDFTGRVILDAGSGQGGLAEHLIARGVEYGAYIGLDAMPEMVEQSRAKRLPEATFEVCDFASDVDAFRRSTPGGAGVDIVVFSGSLNTMDEEHAVAVLDRAWDASGEGVIFNFLSNRAAPKLLAQNTKPARRFDTMRMIDWALSRTPKVQFRQDYFDGHDATIAMLK